MGTGQACVRGQHALTHKVKNFEPDFQLIGVDHEPEQLGGNLFYTLEPIVTSRLW